MNSSEPKAKDWFANPRFSQKLRAQVVNDSESEPTIHGYRVRSDLAKNFTFDEVALLGLLGNEPTEGQVRLFRQAMVYLMPLGIAHAPTHTGVLAHLFCRNFGRSVASAMVVATERARSVIQERGSLLQVLRNNGEGALPGCAEAKLSESVEVSDVVDGLISQTKRLQNRDASSLDLTSALIAVLYECGLTEPWQLESALFLAWCPCIMAETAAHGGKPLESYPIDLPRFDYEP